MASGKVHYAHKPSLKWTWENSAKDMGNGWDVTFTPDGNIAVADHGSKLGGKNPNSQVLLLDGEGKVIASSKKQGVEFEDGPWSVIHDPQESAIIALQGNGLILLDDKTLEAKNKIWLEDEEARAVGVLSNGNFVVTANSPNTVNIYDRDGERIKQFTEYGLPDKDKAKFNRVDYITVLSDDTIVIADRKNLVYMSPDGETKKVMPLKETPLYGLDNGNKADVLVCNEYACIYHIKEKEKYILELRFEGKAGLMTSLAVKGNKMAVLFKYDMRMYEF